MEYIESHLDSEIDIAQAARLAVCSSFHFQRVFSYMAGVTLTWYIRRRRMTLAAFEPAESGARIIGMAQKYGYESPTAFNRAFQSVHGVAPSAARQQGIPLTAYPRLAFHLSIRNGPVLATAACTNLGGDAFRFSENDPDYAAVFRNGKLESVWDTGQ